jgi:hypothetical protein
MMDKVQKPSNSAGTQTVGNSDYITLNDWMTMNNELKKYVE